MHMVIALEVMEVQLAFELEAIVISQGSRTFLVLPLLEPQLKVLDNPV